MKKIADIMEELGFNPDASTGAKKAFIMNLIKTAQIKEELRKKELYSQSNDQKQNPSQMSLFDQKKVG